MKGDPPIRTDGRCAVCKKARVIPKTTYASREQHESDPFCSGRCCRRYHGVAFGVSDDQERGKNMERAA